MTTAINILETDGNRILSVKRFPDGSVFYVGGFVHKTIPVSWTIWIIEKREDGIWIQLNNYEWINLYTDKIFSGKYEDHNINYSKTAAQIEADWNYMSQFIK